MPKALPDHLRHRIVTHLRAGHRPVDIARVEGVGYVTVYRIRTNLYAYGEPSFPQEYHSRSGPKYSVDRAACEALQKFIQSKPWAYQSEMQDFLLDECAIAVDQSTISRTLKRLQITNKSLRREAAERCQDLRINFILVRAQFTASQLIFVDESAANEHTCLRKRGWSELGIKATISVPLARSERYSILPAYCVDGILSHFIYQGSITGATFLWFLEELVLPQYTPFPGPKSVLICDNCSSHKVAGIRALCEAAGVLLLFLPPYSPDFNPIEEFFSVIKAWMKRHNALLDSMAFDDFLEVAMEANKGGKDAKAHFSHAGITLD